MKLILCTLLTTLSLFAQNPRQIVGINANFDQFADSKFTGAAFYAYKVYDGDHPIYSYNAVKLLSLQKEPFRLMTEPTSGAAIHVGVFKNFQIYALGNLGAPISSTSNGTNYGFSYGTGGFALTKFKGIIIGPIAQVSKPTISELQWSIGLILALGSD